MKTKFKMFSPKQLVAKAIKASNKAKIKTLQNRVINKYAELHKVSPAIAEVELWAEGVI